MYTIRIAEQREYSQHRVLWLCFLSPVVLLLSRSAVRLEVNSSVDGGLCDLTDPAGEDDTDDEQEDNPELCREDNSES